MLKYLIPTKTPVGPYSINRYGQTLAYYASTVPGFILCVRIRRESPVTERLGWQED